MRLKLFLTVYFLTVTLSSSTFSCFYFVPAGITGSASVTYFAGSWRDELWRDNWTAVTQDGRRSAQFEETLLVTETGVEVLTKRIKNNGQPYFRD